MAEPLLLDSLVFQLTPTRTRCDLVIVVNGRKQKIASGLLTPFLAHLKAAKDQIAKGGYSILLQPDPAVHSHWFTRGTVERFVRFVSTPEVLERVSTIESEILQIEEAIDVQSHENHGLGNEGSKSVLEDDAENRIVLYKPGSLSNPSDSHDSTTVDENSKVHLLRVLETRKTVLQKEQAMAFARATAAGFDMDHMAYLISFAESFGASRLKEACLQFMQLWKVKHETGQWLEVEALDIMSARSGFSPFNDSGIILSEDAGNDLSDINIDKKLPSDAQVPQRPAEYFQGQMRQPRHPSWPMYPPTAPYYQPYYHNYPPIGQYYQPYPPSEDPRHRTDKMRRNSKNSEDSDSQDEELELNLSDLEKDGFRVRKSHKSVSISRKKKGGKVVIQNLNYVTSKRQQSSSDSETEEETSGLSKKNQANSKSLENSNTNGNDGDSGNWNTFQSFLLKSEEKTSSMADEDLFAGERVHVPKKSKNATEAEPILAPNRESSDIQEVRILEFDSVDGKGRRTKQTPSNDEFLASTEQRDVRNEFKEIEGGGRGYKSVTSDDFMIYGRENQTDSNIYIDPLGDNEYDPPPNLEKSSYVATDESFILPVRSVSTDEHGSYNRTPIDIDLEFPSSDLRKDDSSDKAKTALSYEPDDMTFMPERYIESEDNGYDPALDYDMQTPVNISFKEEKSGDQEDISASNNEVTKETDKEKKLIDKRKTGMRRGLAPKTTPLTEAQKRAEKLRAYKVDLQKAKRENEEEQRKRLEALKLERQKRIAARSNSNASQSFLSQNKKVVSTSVGFGRSVSSR